jgi:hypothetical protein
VILDSFLLFEFSCFIFSIRSSLLGILLYLWETYV